MFSKNKRSANLTNLANALSQLRILIYQPNCDCNNIMNCSAEYLGSISSVCLLIMFISGPNFGFTLKPNVHNVLLNPTDFR